ncbi:MAG TPA: ribbon-helix-helix protein, CopG family [Vicinamibacteria bacterium]|nr:ribbon-helix-helix protein, CopG family [Vicinamibacteria bacterium]
MREMPEVDFRTGRVTRNPYARRIASGGLVVQVGRGRPKRLLESGGTTPRSVRFPDETWALLEKRAKAKGLTLHAALREAILEWARHAA